MNCFPRPSPKKSPRRPCRGSIRPPTATTDGSRASGPTARASPKGCERRSLGTWTRHAFPTGIIVPYIKIVHDRVTLELFRGCTQGCRFCQAGYVYRPVRERGRKRWKNRPARPSEHGVRGSVVEFALQRRLPASRPADHRARKRARQAGRLHRPAFAQSRFVRPGLRRQMRRVRKTGLTFAPEEPEAKRLQGRHQQGSHRGGPR